MTKKPLGGNFLGRIRYSEFLLKKGFHALFSLVFPDVAHVHGKYFSSFLRLLISMGIVFLFLSLSRFDVSFLIDLLILLMFLIFMKNMFLSV